MKVTSGMMATSAAESGQYLSAIRESMRGAVTHLELPLPPLGGKCWVLRGKGIFVLERGPGVLRTIACTHAGSGALEICDGVPDDRGFFPDEHMPEPRPDQFESVESYVVARKQYDSRRGRPLYNPNPIVMGSWMLDGGFLHGLTVRAIGGHESSSAIASIVWMPVPVRAARKPDAAAGGK